jgi:hypothetical protein
MEQPQIENTRDAEALMQLIVQLFGFLCGGSSSRQA